MTSEHRRELMASLRDLFPKPGDLRPAEVAVASEIADACNKHTRTTWGHGFIDEIAALVHISVGEVSNVLSSLERKGVRMRVPIGVDKRGRVMFAGKGRSVTYRCPTRSDIERLRAGLDGPAEDTMPEDAPGNASAIAEANDRFASAIADDCSSHSLTKRQLSLKPSLSFSPPSLSKERGAHPPDPPPPAADAAGPKNGGHPAEVVDDQGENRSNHLLARARELAGPDAVNAITTNPSITETELAALISHTNPHLTQGQSFGRAAALVAWERKAQNDAKDFRVHRGTKPAPVRNRGRQLPLIAPVTSEPTQSASDAPRPSHRATTAPKASAS